MHLPERLTSPPAHSPGGYLLVEYPPAAAGNSATKHPDAVREVHRLLRDSAKGSPDSPRFSGDEIRRSLELMTHYLAQQGLLARPLAVDELFDDVTRVLI